MSTAADDAMIAVYKRDAAALEAMNAELAALGMRAIGTLIALLESGQIPVGFMIPRSLVERTAEVHARCAAAKLIRDAGGAPL